MKVDRRIAILATFLMAASLTQCKKSSTAPFNTRTYSVAGTASVPAVPTAPVTVTTNDPASHVAVTLSTNALQQLAQTAGGAATIKMTDMAPTDYGTLPSTEQAQIGSQPLATLVFDVTKSSAASVAALSGPFDASAISAQTSNGGSASFTVVNNSGHRCNPGHVDMKMIFGSSSVSLGGATIDSNTPQTITANISGVAFTVLHFIFSFECPRVTGGTGAGL